MNYFAKMKGTTKSPPRVSASEIVFSWLGSFLGIGAVAYINFHLVNDSDFVMLIASFGASAVLVYGAIKSPLAQPRNLIGGHVISAFIGVAVFKLFPGQPCLAASLAVPTAVAVMHGTRTLHPPGGATALIAVIGSDNIHAMGFAYALIPAGAGAAVMLLVALVFNNIPGNRRYPEFWL